MVVRDSTVFLLFFQAQWTNLIFKKARRVYVKRSNRSNQLWFIDCEHQQTSGPWVLCILSLNRRNQPTNVQSYQRHIFLCEILQCGRVCHASWAELSWVGLGWAGLSLLTDRWEPSCVACIPWWWFYDVVLLSTRGDDIKFRVKFTSSYWTNFVATRPLCMSPLPPCCTLGQIKAMN